MKKLFLIFPFLILCHLTYAQDIKIEKGMYKKNRNLKQFEGTWQAQKGDKTLVVVLEKHKVHYPRVDINIDQILGWYKYVKGDQTIVNTLNKAGSSNYGDANLIGKSEKNSKQLNLSIASMNHENLLEGSFKFIGNKNQKAILKLRFRKHGDIIIKTPKDKNKNRNTGPKIPVPSTWHMKRIKE